MGLEKLKSTLEASGLPVAYREWPEGKAPALPYICYLSQGTNPLFADGQVFYSSESVDVELYTRLKEPATEAKVEAVLAGYHWKKSQEYISTERCYMTLYEIEV